MSSLQIVGRRSSHFTRVALIVAHELELSVELVPVYDMTQLDSTSYIGNPALKLPTLRREGSVLFGTENICRALAELPGAKRQIVWPEQLREDVARNAQELVWHGMAAQVQLILGTAIAKLPADNIYFTKARAGFEGALSWLNENLANVLHTLPPARDLSLFEVTLFCLIEHLIFRVTVPLEPYPQLLEFARQFGQRPSAQATRYQFDIPPAK